MCKVSVIIPVYNRASLLKEALASVSNQTFKDIEIIVVDDGSDIKELSLIREYCCDVGASLLELEHKGFPGRARNRGVEASKGALVAFLDSDDIWEREKLHYQTKYFLEHKEAKLVHTREIWNRAGKVISQKKQKHKRDGNLFEDALLKCIIGPSTVMMKKPIYSELGGFSDTIEVAEDYEFWLRYTNKYGVGYIDKPLVIKRSGEWNQLSTKYNQIEIFRIKGLRGLLKGGFFTAENTLLARREYVRKVEIYAKGCEKRGKLEESAKWFNEAKMYN